MIDERWLVLDPGSVSGGDRRKQIVRYRLSPIPFGNSSVAAAVPGLRNSIQKLLEIDSLIPHLERRHCRTLAHMLAVGANRRSNSVLPIPGSNAGGAPRDFDTHGQALDVPFPGSRDRFVEIDDIENQVALRRCERSEVHYVAVAARLDAKSGPGSLGQIECH